MKPTSLTIIAAIVLIGAGGFMAGRISSPHASAATQEAMPGRKSSRESSTSSRVAASESARKSAHPDRPARASAESSTDRLARLVSIVRGENLLDRNRALLAFIDQLAPGDFEAAVAHFRSLGITESRFGEYALLLSAWTKNDPLAALAYAKANTSNLFATNTILSSWASIDPEAAIRWAETSHTGDGANPYLPAIIRSLAGADPARATQLLTGMPRSTERGKALDAIMPHVLAQGGDAARAWIAALTDDSLRNGAMMTAAESLAATDPAGTAAWLIANPSQATQQRMDDVYSVWAEKDAQAAVSSLTAMPSGENRSNALRGVVASMSIKDPNAALSMMNRFPNDVNDQVVQQFVWHTLGSEPAMAVNQIARIADEEQRNTAYTKTIGTWLQKDAAAATAWLQAHPLPPAVQAQLNKPR
ncbi:MAG: hypothetical protein NTV46_18690 [Verrucomicrobia bacterium]|nr:hypothetical protein [Verrucomicrobiota bacterium]